MPGPLERLETVTMEFSYARHFKAEPTTGYETLLFDAMAGDQTLFHRMDMVEAGWQVVQPILDAWPQDQQVALPTYDAWRLGTCRGGSAASSGTAGNGDRNRSVDDESALAEAVGRTRRRDRERRRSAGVSAARRSG